MLEKLLQPLLDGATDLLKEYPPDFFIRAVGSAILKVLITAALQSGPPKALLERYPTLSEEAVQGIYNDVLRAALTREEAPK